MLLWATYWYQIVQKQFACQLLPEQVNKLTHLVQIQVLAKNF